MEPGGRGVAGQRTGGQAVMKVFSVGPDGYDPDAAADGLIEWVVYWYQSGDYDGDGDAVARYADGTYRTAGLGHCSCYGPWDDWGSAAWGRSTSLVEILKPPENVLHPDFKPEIRAKVAELVAVDHLGWNEAWRTATVEVLARRMAGESDDAGVGPILADALQDAGCSNEFMLAMLRAKVMLPAWPLWNPKDVEVPT